MATASPGTGAILEHESMTVHDRPWRVIVLNDDHNTFDGVAIALARVIPKVDVARGFELADEIHNSGAAVVWTGAKEVAELYTEQLASLGLTMAPIEQAE